MTPHSFAVTIFAIAVSSAAVGQSSLENPQPLSFQSGIGLISGWSCLSNVRVLIDSKPYTVAHGTARADAAQSCGGNANVGYGLLINYNTLGAGAHVAQLQVNGVSVGGSVPFTVTIPAGEFATGLNGTFDLPNFPANGQTTSIRWQQAQQNFAITEVKTGSTGGGTSGFPIDFSGIRINALRQESKPIGSTPRCELTLNFTNTSSGSRTPYLYFDFIQNGVTKGQTIFSVSSMPAGSTAEDTSSAIIGSDFAACGSFTAQFNAAASHVFNP